jgi:subtilisin family serine protease
MHIYRTQGEQAAYNDPLFLAEPAAGVWRLANLHRLSTGRGISVAVIDSGIESNHPDLTGQIKINRNFVSGSALVGESHGTGVAGVIAARANNGVGIVGIAPGVRLLGLRACWQPPSSPSAYCDTLSLAKALYFAIDSKAPVINLSLSGPNDHLLAELLRIELAHGVNVTAAYNPGLPDGGFPASFPGVISVSNDAVVAQRPGIYLAPGRDVITTQPGGRWSLVAGSSYSAAHVSGLLALLLGVQSRRRAQLIAARTNGGAIDACASLTQASGLCACACSPAPGAQARR